MLPPGYPGPNAGRHALRHLPSSAGRLLLTIALTCALTTTGCTTVRTISPAGVPAAVPHIRAGDTVIVRTTDDRRERFVVERVEGDTVVSTTGVRYARTVVVAVERRGFSPLRTTLLIAGLVGAVFIVAAAAALTALD